jgi:hypothetical protein
MDPTEIASARVCSECGFAKPAFEFYATRKTRKCKVCELALAKRRYERNREDKLKRCAEYRAANKSKIKDYMARRYAETKDEWLARTKAYQARPEVRARNKVRLSESYAANRDVIQAARKEYYATNPEARQRWDAYYRDYYEKHREKFVLRGANRRAARLRATPAWADLAAIEEIYRLAAELTATTGIEYSVDHIVPLRGRNVCGLHVAHNLQVITAEANRQKFNKHWG